MKAPRLEVVDARPAIFDKIVAVFPGAAEPGVVFAYGGKIFAPGARKVSREIDAHERVHIARQGDDCDAWWDRYLRGADFRFEEELVAHAAEYKAFCRHCIDPVKRHARRLAVARKLASPLYGSLITVEQAAIRLDWNYDE